MKNCIEVIRTDRRLVRLSVLYGILFAAAITTGRQLERAGYLAAPRLSDAVLFLCTAAAAAAAAAFLFPWLARHAGGADKTSVPAAFPVKSFLMTWAGLAAAHMIVLLAEYPGFFCYDATDELYEFDMRSFTTHHPLLHELLLGTAVRGGETVFGDVNAGIFLHILLQMLLITGTLALILQVMKRKGISRPVRTCLFLYYAFFPPVVMFSLCSSKDTPFCAFMLIALLLLIRFDPAEGFGHGRCAGFLTVLLAGSAALSMLFRHNAFYAWAACIPVLLLFYPAVRSAAAGPDARYARFRTAKYRLLFSIAASLLICSLVTSALTAFLHAKKEGPSEMLTVPIQQLARLWNDDKNSFTDEELDTLYRYIPEEYLRHYRPNLSDPVKAGFDNAAAGEDLSAFIRLWMTKGLQHPFAYVNGWLNTCYGFWYPGAVINVYAGNTVHTFTYEDSSYFGYEVEYPGERHSLIPVIDGFYRRLSIERFQQEIPVVSLLFAPAFYLWLWTLVLFYLLWKKDRQVFTLLPVFLYILTLLLGPTYLVRYVILLFFGLGLLPVITAAADRT